MKISEVSIVDGEGMKRMRIRVPSYYKRFECIASVCDDTCCAGWDVVIDEQTRGAYRMLDGALGDKLRSKMVVDQDGDTIFILDGERCPFLNDYSLCDIYKEKGEQYLCHTCKQYPRYMEDFFDLREMGISLSCPEAARIILRDTNPCAFELLEQMAYSEDSESSHVVNQIERDEHRILEAFFQCRTTIIQILELKEISLGIRVAIVLRFVEELQDKLDFAEMDRLNLVRKKYNRRNYLEGLIQEFHTYKVNEASKYNDVYEYFVTYKELEHIHKKDPLGINQVLETFWKADDDRERYRLKHQEFSHFYAEKSIQFEKILVYFVYRYFMKAFYDYDMSSKIKVAIMSTIMIKELAVVRWMDNGVFNDEDLVDISHMYSKDVEHLIENIETLETIFETEDIYSVERLIHTCMSEF